MLPAVALGWLLLGEGCLWLERRDRRRRVWQAACARAEELGRPLVVVGAPDGGVTAGYGCGDVTIDIAPSACPCSVRWDICDGMPLPDDSCVVYVSCVLEYVRDWKGAVAELERVSGGELFLVTVEPFSLTGWMYPGTRLPVPWSLQRRYGIGPERGRAA